MLFLIFWLIWRMPCVVQFFRGMKAGGILAECPCSAGKCKLRESRKGGDCTLPQWTLPTNGPSTGPSRDLTTSWSPTPLLRPFIESYERADLIQNLLVETGCGAWLGRNDYCQVQDLSHSELPMLHVTKTSSSELS